MANRPGVPSPNITPYIGPVLARHRATEYRALGGRNLLNRLNGSTMPFGWTVNPFRGCQVGCAYCYARDTHQYLGHADPREFDADLTRRLEPLAPRPDLRFRAMATLARAGVPTRLYIMPVLPGLTDGDGTLRALLEAAREAGCRETRWNLLFLRPGVRELFLARLTEEFRSLAARYRKLYARSAYVPREYRDEVAGRILARARAAGLAPPKGDAATEKPRQLALTW